MVCKTSDINLNKMGGRGYAGEVAGSSPVEGTGNIGRRNHRVVLQGRVRELAPGRRLTLGVMVVV